MGIEFTAQESAALYGLLAESATDIILKTDREGFIRSASPAIERMGLVMPGVLIWPHILDLADPACAPAIATAHKAAISGEQTDSWNTLCARTPNGDERTFEVRMRGLTDERGEVYGALTVMRCVEEMRTLEDRLFAAEMTDPLTGLTNRRAFTSMLHHLVEGHAQGCVAILEIDHFKAINLRHGQSVGDTILTAFADLLRKLTRTEDILSRIGGESFGILMPETGLGQARTLIRDVIDTLARLARPTAPEDPLLTASAGLVRIGHSIDTTIKSAELAVFFARSKGRNGLEVGDGKLRA